jgi:hypothetical protein
MCNIALKFGALLVFPDHRYYGKSMPFGNETAAYKDKDSFNWLLRTGYYISLKFEQVRIGIRSAALLQPG